jgi:hypothetical protein
MAECFIFGDINTIPLDQIEKLKPCPDAPGYNKFKIKGLKSTFYSRKEVPDYVEFQKILKEEFDEDTTLIFLLAEAKDLIETKSSWFFGSSSIEPTPKNQEIANHQKALYRLLLENSTYVSVPGCYVLINCPDEKMQAEIKRHYDAAGGSRVDTFITSTLMPIMKEIIGNWN